MISDKSPRRSGPHGAAADQLGMPSGCRLSDQAPLRYGAAVRALADCAVSTARLLWRRRVHLPTELVGTRLRFADETSARVYRETVVGRGAAKDPCVLVVEFRLRMVRGRGHAAFRWESLLNTPLFVGFPGFASKLWLAHDERGRYRGVYEWDGPRRADHYARALWRVLALVSVPGSIHYVVLPGLRRDEFLARPQALARAVADGAAWWRPAAALDLVMNRCPLPGPRENPSGSPSSRSRTRSGLCHAASSAASMKNGQPSTAPSSRS
jgi:hypothetical protein